LWPDLILPSYTTGLLTEGRCSLVAWPHPSFIHHRTPDGRPLLPLCRLTRIKTK